VKSAASAAVVALLATVTALAIGIRTALHLPGLPYNVKELFLNRGAALVVFAFALVWVGAGSMLLAKWLARSARPAVALPVGVVVLAMISRTLLKYSVTYESLDDILGTNNLVLRVVHENMWGDFWRHAFDISSVAELASYLERRVRYTALYSPIAVCLAVALLPTVDARLRASMNRRYLWSLGASAVVWLWLSKTVVFTWAATDNLTELVAQGSTFGLGGTLSLYLIVVIMAVNVALLIRASTRPAWWIGAALFSVAAVPIGWLLLGLGLEPHVQKYGSVFSGAQFLLGPDRQHRLGDVALFARWAVVQTGGVAVMFAGAWIGERVTVPQSFRLPSTAAPHPPVAVPPR